MSIEAIEGRIRQVNGAPIRPGRGYVLYWMIAARRTRFNFALDRALAHARELRRPLAGRLLYKPAGAAMSAADSNMIPRLLFQAARGGTDQ